MAKKNQIDIKVNYIPDTGALQAATKEIQNVKVNVGGQDIGRKLVSPIQDAIKQLNNALSSGMGSKEVTRAFDDVKKSIDGASKQAKGMSSEINAVFNSAGNQKLLKDLDTYNKKLKIAEQDLKRWNEQYGKVATSAKKAELHSVGIMGGAREVDKVIKTYETAQKANIKITAELEKQYDIAKKHRSFLDAKQSSSKGDIEARISSNKSHIGDIASQGVQTAQMNTTDIKSLSSALEKLEFIYLQVDAEAEDYTETLKKQSAEVEANSKKINKITDIAAGTLLGTSAANMLEDALRQGIEFFKEYDETLTRTMMVTGMTREETLGLTGAYSELASQLSSTIKDVAAAQLVFYQQGLGTQDALSMTEASIAISKTGGIAAEEAANRLTAAVKGYQVAAGDAMEIADKMSALDAAAASSVDELTVAMQKSASQARMAGLDLDYYMAYLSTMQEVTREAPENIGTAMKSITARMQEISDIGKIEEDGTTFNNVAKALSSIGISATDSAGQLKPLQEIMDQLGPQWESLDRNHQAYIATVLAGNRQQSRFIALMDNYDRALELVDVSQNASGESAKQLRALNQGLGASFTALSNEWQEFATTIADSSMIKSVIDMLTGFVEIVNSLPDGLVQAVTYFKLFNMGLETFRQVNQNLSKSSIDFKKIFSFDTEGLKKFGNTITSTFDKVSKAGTSAEKTITKITEGTNKLTNASDGAAAAEARLTAGKSQGVNITNLEKGNLVALNDNYTLATQGSHLFAKGIKTYTEAMNLNDTAFDKEQSELLATAGSVGHQVFTEDVTGANIELGQYEKQLQDLNVRKTEEIKNLYDKFYEDNTRLFGAQKGNRTKELKREQSKKDSGQLQLFDAKDTRTTYERDLQILRKKVPGLNLAIVELENQIKQETAILESKIKGTKEIITRNTENLELIKRSNAEIRKNNKALSVNTSSKEQNTGSTNLNTQGMGYSASAGEIDYVNSGEINSMDLSKVSLQPQPQKSKSSFSTFMTGGPKGNAANFSQIGQTLKSTAPLAQKTSGVFEELGKSVNMTNIASGFMAGSIASMATEFIGLEGPLADGITATAGLMPMLKGLGPWGIAAAVGIGALTAGYKALYPTVEEVQEKLTALATEADELTQSQTNIETSLEVYDDLSKKLNRTEEEQNSLNNAIDTLQSEVPGIVSGYNSMGEAILDTSKATAELAQNQKMLAENSDSMLKSFGRLQQAEGPGFWTDLAGIFAPNWHNSKEVEANKKVWAENYEEIYSSLQNIVMDTVDRGTKENEMARKAFSDSILSTFSLEGLSEGRNINKAKKEIEELYDSFSYGDLDAVVNLAERTKISGEITSASWSETKEKLKTSLQERFSSILSDEEFEIVLDTALGISYSGGVNIAGVQAAIDAEIEKEKTNEDWDAKGEHFKQLLENLEPEIVSTLDEMGMLNTAFVDFFSQFEDSNDLETYFKNGNGEIDTTLSKISLLNDLETQRKKLINESNLEESKKRAAELEKELENQPYSSNKEYSLLQPGSSPGPGDTPELTFDDKRGQEAELKDLNEEIRVAEEEAKNLDDQINALKGSFESIKAPSFGEMAESIEGMKSNIQSAQNIIESLNNQNNKVNLDNITEMFSLLDNYDIEKIQSLDAETFALWGDSIDKINGGLVVQNGELVAQEGVKEGLNQLTQVSAKIEAAQMKQQIARQRVETELQQAILQGQIAAIDSAIKELEAAKTLGAEGVDVELSVKTSLDKIDMAAATQAISVEVEKNNEILAINSKAASEYSRIWAEAEAGTYGGDYSKVTGELTSMRTSLLEDAKEEIMGLVDMTDIDASIAGLENMKEGLQGQVDLNNQILNGLATKEKIADYLASSTTDLGAMASDAADSQSDYNEQLERTLTLLEKIEGLQHAISKNESLKSLYEGYDGEAYAKILMSNLDLAKQEYEVQKELFAMQQEITNQAAGDLLDSPYGQMFSISENGDIGWATDEMYSKYKGMPDHMQEDIDGLVQAFQEERDELRDVESALNVYAEATKAAREEIVAMEIEIENELVEALKNREKILHEARTKALDDEISMIEEAMEARQKAREDDDSEKELYEAQEALRRATLDSSGKNNSSLLQLQQDLEDKQLEISEKRFEADMEDRMQWLEDTKDAETETYEYRLETMTWYWENVAAIQEMGQEAMMQTLIMWNEEYRTQSALQQGEMEREWKFTMDAMKTAADMGAELGKLTSDIVSTTNAVENMTVKVNALAGSWRAAASAAGSYSGGSYGGGSGGGYGNSSGGQQIHTDYYKGAINPDAVHGTFGAVDKNNVKYQPNNIGGVRLTSTGAKAGNVGIATNSSGVPVKDQTLWKLRTGQYFIWNGTKNRYEDAVALSKPVSLPGYDAVFGFPWDPAGSLKKAGYKYAEGGIVDYTGPAWVDGTKSKPEAFLNPYQTEQIAALAHNLSGQGVNSATTNSNINFGSVNFNVASMSSSADGKKALETFVQGANDLMAKKGIGTRLNINTK